jgi:hypothetical protein
LGGFKEMSLVPTFVCGILSVVLGIFYFTGPACTKPSTYFIISKCKAFGLLRDHYSLRQQGNLRTGISIDKIKRYNSRNKDSSD